MPDDTKQACLGVARETNCKLQGMASSEIFENNDFLWKKNTVEWRIRIRGLGWHVSKILLKGENLDQKLKKFCQFVLVG